MSLLEILNLSPPRFMAKNVRVVVDDVSDRVPDPAGVDLPNREKLGTNNLVEVVHEKTGLSEQMLWSEVRGLANYVDNNIQSLTALPSDLMNLTVKKFTLTYTGGRKLGIFTRLVSLGSEARAEKYQLSQQGFVVPLDDTGQYSFDTNNTPNVVICLRWIDQEIARRKQERQDYAELVAPFSSAVSGLAGAAAAGHGIKPAPEPYGGLPKRNTGGAKVGGTKPTTGGGSTGGTTGGGKPVAPAKPPGSGGGSKPVLGQVKRAKQDQHSYVLSKRNEPKPDPTKPPPKPSAHERNQRLAKLMKAQDGATPGASLLNEKYSSSSAEAAVQKQVQVEIDAGRFKTDKNGAMSMILDMHERTGWVLDGNLTPTESTKLDIRIDTKGSWHFFPSL